MKGDSEDKGLTPSRPGNHTFIWVNYGTDTGVDPAGNFLKIPTGGRRKNPNLHDILEAARLARADRVMLCGDEAPTGYQWLLPSKQQIQRGNWTPGWSDAGHYLADPARGRFIHDQTKHRVTITTTAEWFGAKKLSAATAKESYDVLTTAIAWAIDRKEWGLGASPSATGMNMWKRSLDKKRSELLMQPLPRDIGELIQATDPQHRVEHYVDSRGRCDCGDCLPLVKGSEIPGFAYADGRFMYAGVIKSFGTAPATMMTAAQCEEQFRAGPIASQGFPKGAFLPARYRIRFTVPDMWDHLGIFPMKKEGAGSGWHWPNNPGYVGETWANAVEIRTAILEGGWDIEFLEGINFTPGNVLGPFRTFIDNALKLLDDGLQRKRFSATVHAAATSAVKHILRVTIGSFSRRSRLTTRFAASDQDVSPNAVGKVEPADNGGLIYHVASPGRFDDDATWHPEIAAQLWGEARCQVLAGRRRVDGRSLPFGALQIDPEQLIGIQGDAIYTTEVQPWTLPISHGGMDDGENGRIRIKGYLQGPMPAPQTIDERHVLSDRAEEAGWA